MLTRSLSSASLRRVFEDWRASGSGPAYQLIAQRLRYAVLDGRLPLGVRLPGERTLAAELGVARITVSQAYDQLRSTGYLRSEPGSGTSTCLPCGTEEPDLLPDDDPDLLDMAAATVEAHEYVAPAYRQAMERLPALLPSTGYQTRGEPGFRQAVSELYAGQGLRIGPDAVLATHGAQHGLALVIRALIRPGDAVAIEQPSYPNAIAAFRQAGARIRSYPVSHEGWPIDDLERDLARGHYKLAYLIPDHQNPTGAVMPAEHRLRLERAARRGGAVLVFDECIRELWLNQPPPVFDTAYGHDHLIRLGSLSKLYWGGLRTGWIATSKMMADRMHAIRPTLDLGTPPMEQLAARALMSDFPDAADIRRAQLRDQHAYLSEKLASGFPDWTINPIEGGLSVWVRLPKPVSTQLAGQARDLGLKLEPGHRFSAQGRGEHNLRLPYCRKPDEIDRALDLLEQAWRSVGRRSGTAEPAPVELAAVL